jgi:DNA-binding NarL/FixJ family response regulator
MRTRIARLSERSVFCHSSLVAYTDDARCVGEYLDTMADLRLISAPAEMQESPVPSPIRVLLAERHALLSSGLRLLLDAEDDIETIAEADDLQATLRHIQGERPHVLVVGLGMLGGSARETIGRLRARAPETQVVLLTMDESALVAQHVLACGALGFVLKDRADDELASAVRAAARGEQFVSPGVITQLDGALRETRT